MAEPGLPENASSFGYNPMKTVIKRHSGEYQIFRALAIAQAAARAGDLALVDCFQIHQTILDLVPAVTWKNPHAPFAFGAERQHTDSNGHVTVRPAGNVYDRVIDLNGGGGLDEFEWSQTGLDWCTWARGKASAAVPGLKVEPFPEITLPTELEPVAAVLISPLSDQADPRQVNVNRLENYAKSKFPGDPIFWHSPENMNLGNGRCAFDICGGGPFSFVRLAQTLQRFKAVIAVDGLVAALAQSTYRGAPLVKRFALVEPWELDPTHLKPELKGGFNNSVRQALTPEKPDKKFLVDRFHMRRRLLRTELTRGSGPAAGRLQVQRDGLELKELVPIPTD